MFSHGEAGGKTYKGTPEVDGPRNKKGKKEKIRGKENQTITFFPTKGLVQEEPLTIKRKRVRVKAKKKLYSEEKASLRLGAEAFSEETNLSRIRRGQVLGGAWTHRVSEQEWEGWEGF